MDVIVDPVVTAEIRKALEKVDIVYIDVDGCLMPESEYARAKAYAALLEEATGEPQDVQAVHDEWAGPPVNITIAKIKGRYKDKLKKPYRQYLEEHDALYFEYVKEQDPNPYVLEIMNISKETGKTCLFISNGRDNGIRSIFGHFGIKGFDDAVLAYDSPGRKIDGKRVPDKVAYFAHCCNERGIPFWRAMGIEDNSKTAERLAALRGDKGGVIVLYVFNGHNKPEAGPSVRLNLDCTKKPTRGVLPTRNYALELAR